MDKKASPEQKKLLDSLAENPDLFDEMVIDLLKTRQLIMFTYIGDPEQPELLQDTLDSLWGIVFIKLDQTNQRLLDIKQQIEAVMESEDEERQVST